jgi:hypothetical protein
LYLAPAILLRRFIIVEFDAQMEDPEARSFSIDIRQQVKSLRIELLADALTIWRWGRIDSEITPGKPMGSFEQWCQWVRDPSVTLGCQDPAERVKEAKEQDSRRQSTAEIFTLWWASHRDQPLAASGLDKGVARLLDPHGRGRQFLASRLLQLTGTRIAGLLLTRQAAAGKWGAATYAMKLTGGDVWHRDHRGDRSGDAEASPYAPDADDRPTRETGVPPRVSPSGIADHRRETGPEEHRDHRGHRSGTCPDDAYAPYADAEWTEKTEGQPRNSRVVDGRTEAEARADLSPNGDVSRVVRKEPRQSSGDLDNFDDLEIPPFLRRMIGDDSSEHEVAVEADLSPEAEVAL